MEIKTQPTKLLVATGSLSNPVRSSTIKGDATGSENKSHTARASFLIRKHAAKSTPRGFQPLLVGL